MVNIVEHDRTSHEVLSDIVISSIEKEVLISDALR